MTVITTFLRNDASAAQRVDESRDLQQTYLGVPATRRVLRIQGRLLRDTNTGDSYYDSTDPTTAVRLSRLPHRGKQRPVAEVERSFGGTVEQWRVQYRTQVDERRDPSRASELLRRHLAGTAT